MYGSTYYFNVEAYVLYQYQYFKYQVLPLMYLQVQVLIPIIGKVQQQIVF